MPGPYAQSNLGKFEKVQVRGVWPDEAKHFTPWLAEQGLELLRSELNVDLRLIKREHAVGRYSLDILAVPSDVDDDAVDANLVVIENQFGSSDHDHLGKLMTYASGVGAKYEGAKTVIWIAESIGEEHRRALVWLNTVTQPSVSFYGVQLELYRIGDSEPAPALNVVVKPDEVGRARRQAGRAAEESERNLFYVEYWTALKEYCVNHESLFRLQTPRAAAYIWLRWVGQERFFPFSQHRNQDGWAANL